MFRRLLAVFLAFAGMCFSGGMCRGDELATKPLTFSVKFHSGAFEVLWYAPAVAAKAKAVLVFGSGDGGWSYWEEHFCSRLRELNYFCAGFDTRKYADAAFAQKELAADLKAVSEEAVKRSGNRKLRVVWGGWSTGAEWSVAAAAVNPKPASLAGLLLLAPGERSRYGIDAADLLGVTPTGDDTYALVDHAEALGALRVVQFHGEYDPLDNYDWLSKIPNSQWELRLYPGSGHGFGAPDDAFLNQAADAVGWILSNAPAGPRISIPYRFTLADYVQIGVTVLLILAVLLLQKRPALITRSLAVLLFAAGVLNVIAATFNKQPEVLDWVEQYVPFDLSEGSRMLLWCAGLLEILLSRGVWRRKRNAWRLAVLALALAPLLHLGRAFDWRHALSSCALLCVFLLYRKWFIARSDGPSFRLAVWVFLGALAALVIFGIFSLSAYQAEISGNQTPVANVQTVLELAFLQSTDTQVPTTDRARTVFLGIQVAALLSGVVVVFLALRPVLRRQHPSDEESQRLRAIVERHGVDPLNEFAFLPDKRCFFCEHPAGECAVAYAVWRNVAVTLADPIGPAEAMPSAVNAFIAFCREQDWKPVFYEVGETFTSHYRDLNFTVIKIGEDARLDPHRFELKGGKFQNLRTAQNKARKTGQSFRWYSGAPVDHGLEAQLQVLSDNWLKAKKGPEMTFDLGRFSLDEIRRGGVAVVVNDEQRVEAFATWRPYQQGRGRCIDIMRSRPEARDIMDFLILESISYFRDQGVTEISLGNAPLANTSYDPAAARLGEKAINYLYENFNQLYGYKSLFKFKEKYQPEWRGRYLAYPAGMPLPLAAAALVRVHVPQGLWRMIWS